VTIQDQPGRYQAGPAAADASPSVLLVTDQDVRGARLEARLRSDPRLRVSIATPSELPRLLRDSEPAVLVLPVSIGMLPRRLRILPPQSPPRVPVLILTAEPRLAWTSQARRAGVQGVLRDDATPDELSVAVMGMIAGLVVLDAAVFGPRSESASRSSADSALTAREMDVLEMMADGMSNRVIAARLSISTHTVKFHVAAVLAKLQAGSRTEAVTIAVRRGLIAV
jgi:DNA-binding NarL/FixJ family response regulator